MENKTRNKKTIIAGVIITILLWLFMFYWVASYNQNVATVWQEQTEKQQLKQMNERIIDLQYNKQQLQNAMNLIDQELIPLKVQAKTLDWNLMPYKYWAEGEKLTSFSLIREVEWPAGLIQNQ